MADWKGLLKKGVEAAKTAKSELEERGLIGNQQGQEASSAPPPPSGGTSPREEAAEILGPGHTNPFNLLSTSDVQQIFGGHGDVPAEPKLSTDETAAGPFWNWNHGGTYFTATLMIYADATPEDVAQWMVDGDGGGPSVPEPGLGEEAFMGPGWLTFAQGGETVVVTALGPASHELPGVLRSMAKRASERLPAAVSLVDKVAAQTPMGHPNLATLFTADEAAQLLGRPVRTPRFEVRDGEGRLRFESTDDEYRVELRHSLANDWFDTPSAQAHGMPGGQLGAALGNAVDQLKASMAGLVQPLPGVSDEAFVGDGQIGFRKSGQVVGVSVSGPDGWDPAPYVLAVAKTAAARIP